MSFPARFEDQKASYSTTAASETSRSPSGAGELSTSVLAPPKQSIRPTRSESTGFGRLFWVSSGDLVVKRGQQVNIWTVFTKRVHKIKIYVAGKVVASVCCGGERVPMRLA